MMNVLGALVTVANELIAMLYVISWAVRRRVYALMQRLLLR